MKPIVLYDESNGIDLKQIEKTVLSMNKKPGQEAGKLYKEIRTWNNPSSETVWAYLQSTLDFLLKLSHEKI